MWCDNCLLVFPLKHGAIAWNVLIALYSLAGSIFLFRYGAWIFFTFPEWDIYGGVGMAVMSLSVISIIGLSNYSYMFTRLAFFLWPIVIIASAVRAGFMIFQLNREQSKIVWECDNGGQMWASNAEDGYDTTSMPAGICTAGFHNLYIAFVLSLLVDLVCQLYAYFLSWRFKARIEHTYRQVRNNDKGYYA